jgi:predicted Zn finger-like uncharacterized protein
MIVQCDQCNAKFRLEDSKVKDGGAKVRCSKCKHIFVVQREMVNDEADYDSLLKGLVPPTPEAPKEPIEAASPNTGQFAAEAGEPSGIEITATEERTEKEVSNEKDDFEFEGFAFDTGAADDLPVASYGAEEKGGFDFGELNLGADASAGEKAEAPEKEVASFDADAFSLAEEPPPAAPEKVAAAGSGTQSFDHDEFSFDEEPPPTASEKATAGGSGTPSFDYDSFSFDEEPSLTASEKEATPKSELPDEFSFSDEPPPLPFEKQAAVESEIPVFDFDTFTFSEEQNQPVPDIETKSDGLAASPVSGDPVTSRPPHPSQQKEDLIAVPALDFSFEPAGGEPASAPLNANMAKSVEHADAFDFGEFEFGDAVPAEKPVENGGVPAGQEAWSEEKPGPVSQDNSGDFSISELSVDHDLPPFAISSRRRSGSYLPIAVTAISVLLVLVLAGGGFYFFKEGPAALNRSGLGFMVKWFGLEAKEEGVIARNTAAVFLNNKAAGEIFVINGEAFNKFAKPRASIQVKATVYGPKGEALLQKTAYCGNVLSKEQLMALPMAEIEKSMVNPFGDSLSNLSVQPGKGIPFVVVFPNVPKGASDFGIEVVGSTIASK